MKKLKLQFGLFFFSLALALGFLLFNSYRQMDIEERSLWEGISEKTYNQMQATISEFLTQEDARSFSEYRYYQVAPQPNANESPRIVSPLALNLPEEDPRGLVGYFQIDPDGTFSTPYLPKGESEPKPPDLARREERERDLKDLTQSLQQEVKKETKKTELGFMSPEKTIPMDKYYDSSGMGMLSMGGGGVGKAQNIYPNPLLKSKSLPSPYQKEDLVDKKAQKFAEAPTAASPSVGAGGTTGAAPPTPVVPQAQLARREVAPNAKQLKVFEEQNQAKEAPARGGIPTDFDTTGSSSSAPSGSLFKKEGKPSSLASVSSAGSAMPLPPSPPADFGALRQLEGPSAFPGRKMSSGGEKDLRVLSKKRGPKAVSESLESLPESYSPPSLLIDPFQSRFLSAGYLVFYRKIWVDQKMYLQGFLVKLDPFYEWLMGQSFANSELTTFAWAQLNLGNVYVARYGPHPPEHKTPFLLFERGLGYPLNFLVWKVFATSIPKLSTHLYLNLFTVIIIVLATVGLYFIYRSAAAQVILSQKRQDFVSAVTHELKTPLTSIRMYSEMLEDDWVKEEEKKREYYRHISKESGRLTHLIDNILQLARLEKRNYKLNLKKESPAKDFEQIGQELQKLAETQGFSLELKASADLPPLSYDPEALQEILLILLDNSVKFSKNGFEKALEMRLEREGDRVVWSWGDRGPGVLEKELGKVFDKFYRVENEMTRNTKGTGIGLAMAKIIVEAMGGQVEARSRDGGGLWVRILLPI